MSSNDTTETGEPLVFGVPSTTVAEALRAAGLDDQAVIAVLGRAVARSTPGSGPAGFTAAGSAGAHNLAALSGFTFTTQIAETAPECGLTYQRVFVHPDVIDGVTVVQGAQTPDEMGLNARFHAIEAEFDAISRDLQTSSNCVAELRRELFLLTGELEAKITEIDARIDAKGKDKDSKEGKETKEGKEGKESKEKDTKEGKDKEGKDGKDSKDKDHKEGKEGKEGKEHIDKVRASIEKITAIEKLTAIENTPLLEVPRGTVTSVTPPTAAPTGSAHTFISLEDRPDVQAGALGDPEPATKKAVAKKAVAKKEAATKAVAKRARTKKKAAKKAATKQAATPATED